MSELHDFQFHLICKGTKLTHLIFADDLMIFCKGDVRSVNRVKEVLDRSSKVTGLTANLDKSSIFIAGVEDAIQQQILSTTSFSLCSLPIRYLGLLLTSRKWTKVECQHLVDKIYDRVKTAYAKHLSNAGRL